MEVGFYTGKENNLQYRIVKTIKFPKIEFQAYAIGETKEKLAGSSLIEKVNETDRDPRLFLSLPEIPYKKPIWEPHIVTYDQKQGLASRLHDELISELERRKGLIVVSFTEDGKTFMQKKYKQMGFQDCEIKDKTKMPDWAKEVSNWMFFDYINL